MTVLQMVQNRFWKNITGNKAGTSGGGIHNTGTLTITGGSISQNTAVSLHGGGIYPVQWAVTNSYKQISASVFTAAHEDKVYTCAWSGNGQYQVGDTLPREVE